MARRRSTRVSCVSAIRMVIESKGDYGSEYEAIRSISAKLGIASPESLRKWLRQAESQIGLYKAELIRPDGPGAESEHVEIETLNYVRWFNHERPHGAVDDLPPAVVEQIHYAARNELEPTG